MMTNDATIFAYFQAGNKFKKNISIFFLIIGKICRGIFFALANFCHGYFWNFLFEAPTNFNPKGPEVFWNNFFNKFNGFLKTSFCCRGISFSCHALMTIFQSFHLFQISFVSSVFSHNHGWAWHMMLFLNHLKVTKSPGFSNGISGLQKSPICIRYGTPIGCFLFDCQKWDLRCVKNFQKKETRNKKRYTLMKTKICKTLKKIFCRFFYFGFQIGKS